MTESNKGFFWGGGVWSYMWPLKMQLKLLWVGYHVLESFRLKFLFDKKTGKDQIYVLKLTQEAIHELPCEQSLLSLGRSKETLLAGCTLTN